MKKLLSIIFVWLLLIGNVYSEEIILRCTPKITTVRSGDMQVGGSLWDRVIYAKFKEEFDLTKSEKPIKSIKKINLYLINDKGKKDKFSVSDGNYSEKGKTKRFDFEDIWETKTYKSYSIALILYSLVFLIRFIAMPFLHLRYSVADAFITLAVRIAPEDNVITQPSQHFIAVCSGLAILRPLDLSRCGGIGRHRGFKIPRP